MFIQRYYNIFLYYTIYIIYDKKHYIYYTNNMFFIYRINLSLNVVVSNFKIAFIK